MLDSSSVGADAKKSVLLRTLKANSVIAVVGCLQACKRALEPLLLLLLVAVVACAGLGAGYCVVRYCCAVRSA
jgi:lysozyme family protein